MSCPDEMDSAQLEELDVAKKEEYISLQKNALAKANRAVLSVAESLGIFPQNVLKEHFFLTGVTGKYDLLESRLESAIDDPKRPKFGEFYPFKDIIGAEYLTLLRDKFERGADAKESQFLELTSENTIMPGCCVLFFCGILRDGEYVASNNCAPHSLQMRFGKEVRDQVWCVPFEFWPACWSCLEGVFQISETHSNLPEVTDETITNLWFAVNSRNGKLSCTRGSRLISGRRGGVLYVEGGPCTPMGPCLEVVQPPVTVKVSGRIRNPRVLFNAASIGSWQGARAGGRQMRTGGFVKFGGGGKFDADEVGGRMRKQTKPVIVKRYNPNAIVIETLGYRTAPAGFPYPSDMNERNLRRSAKKIGSEWFGDEYFAINLKKVIVTPIAKLHKFFHVLTEVGLEQSFFKKDRNPDLDIYFNNSANHVDVNIHASSFRVFYTLREVEEMMDSLDPTDFDVLGTICALFNSHQRSTVTKFEWLPGTFLFLRSDTLRQFVQPWKCEPGSVYYFNGSTEQVSNGSAVNWRSQIFPLTQEDQDDIVDGLKSSNFVDMLMQFQFKEIVCGFSAQLEYLYMNESLFSKSIEFQLEKKNLSLKFSLEMIDMDPTSSLQQEALRHCIIDYCLNHVKTTKRELVGTSMFGCSFWALRDLCRSYTRRNMRNFVNERTWLFFVANIPVINLKKYDQSSIPLALYVAGLPIDQVLSSQFPVLLNRKRQELNQHMEGVEFIDDNDYSELEGGMESFLKIHNFDENVTNCFCDCEDYCDEACVNVISSIECNSSNCRWPSAKCFNRPSVSARAHQLIVKKTSNRGFGLFGAIDFSSNTILCEYTGVISWNKPPVEDKYILRGSFPYKTTIWFINGTRTGSIARFANHSCDPNCYLQRIGDTSDPSLLPKFFLRTIARVPVGDELTWDYSENYAEGDCIVRQCLCGSANCISLHPALGGPDLLSPARSDQCEEELGENFDEFLWDILLLYSTEYSATEQLLEMDFFSETQVDSFKQRATPRSIATLRVNFTIIQSFIEAYACCMSPNFFLRQQVFPSTTHLGIFLYNLMLAVVAEDSRLPDFLPCQGLMNHFKNELTLTKSEGEIIATCNSEQVLIKIQKECFTPTESSLLQMTIKVPPTYITCCDFENSAEVDRNCRFILDDKYSDESRISYTCKLVVVDFEVEPSLIDPRLFPEFLCEYYVHFPFVFVIPFGDDIASQTHCMTVQGTMNDPMLSEINKLRYQIFNCFLLRLLKPSTEIIGDQSSHDICEELLRTYGFKRCIYLLTGHEISHPFLPGKETLSEEEEGELKSYSGQVVLIPELLQTASERFSYSVDNCDVEVDRAMFESHAFCSSIPEKIVVNLIDFHLKSGVLKLHPYSGNKPDFASFYVVNQCLDRDQSVGIQIVFPDPQHGLATYYNFIEDDSGGKRIQLSNRESIFDTVDFTPHHLIYASYDREKQPFVVPCQDIYLDEKNDDDLLGKITVCGLGTFRLQRESIPPLIKGVILSKSRSYRLVLHPSGVTIAKCDLVLIFDMDTEFHNYSLTNFDKKGNSEFIYYLVLLRCMVAFIIGRPVLYKNSLTVSLDQFAGSYPELICRGIPKEYVFVDSFCIDRLVRNCSWVHEYISFLPTTYSHNERLFLNSSSEFEVHLSTSKNNFH